jgi:glycosyltransferase involved in cell wall biosynthesis
MVPSKIYGIMAVGKPVIFVGPEESEVAEIIRASGCGFVVEPGDWRLLVRRYLELFEDAALRNELGAAGRRYFCEQFDRPLATAQFGEILGEAR